MSSLVGHPATVEIINVLHLPSRRKRSSPALPVVGGEGKEDIVATRASGLQIAAEELSVEPLQSIKVLPPHPRWGRLRVRCKLGNGFVTEPLPCSSRNLFVPIRQMCPPMVNEHKPIGAPRGTESPQDGFGVFAVSNLAPRLGSSQTEPGIVYERVDLKARRLERRHQGGPACWKRVAPTTDANVMWEGSGGDRNQRRNRPSPRGDALSEGGALRAQRVKIGRPGLSPRKAGGISTNAIGNE